MSVTWAADTMLPGYETRTIALPEEPTYALEPQSSLVATLIRRGKPSRRRAVLYIHGWSDYFFQGHLGDAFDALGIDFYAIDLRRYGRSLRDGQLAGYITDVRHYRTELDEALSIILEDGHDVVDLCGHSTGGLVAALYADERPDTFATLLLNSPWIEIQSSPMVRYSLQPLMRTVSAVAPTTALPVSDNGFYTRSISASQDGEWNFDPHLKGDPSFLIRIGWAKAILSGQALVEKGLNVDAPILVLTSGRSVGGLVGGQWTDDYLRADGVLDVRRIAERSHHLGNHVTLVKLDGALHDVALSAQPVRRRAFDELRRFLDAYGTA